MNPEFFRIALAKTSDPVALALLDQMEHAAMALAAADAAFPERMNANKAKRGEHPTQLSKSRKQQLAALAQDKIDLDAKLCEDFRKMTDPSQIVWSAHHALTQDLANSRQFLKYYHPDDLPLGGDIVHLKSQLLEDATSFLETYPLAEE